MSNKYMIPILLGVILIITILIIIALREEKRKLKEDLSKRTKERDSAKEREKIIAEELEKKKIENLRFALNPHSFKNTLGAIEHNAKVTLKSVESLSGIFDYMLYDAKHQFVSLNQELQFATDYLNLNRVRLKPTINITSKPFDKLELKTWGENKVIAPLILAHFIENAFKHGDLESDEAFIKINLEILNDNEFIYSVRNKIPSNKRITKGGLGNDTFIERLELLYKGKYHYDYKEENGKFSANLKLKLYDK